MCVISLNYICSEIKYEVHLFQRNKHQKNKFWLFKLGGPVYIVLLTMVLIIVIKINKN